MTVTTFRFHTVDKPKIGLLKYSNFSQMCQLGIVSTVHFYSMLSRLASFCLWVLASTPHTPKRICVIRKERLFNKGNIPLIWNFNAIQICISDGEKRRRTTEQLFLSKIFPFSLPPFHLRRTLFEADIMGNLTARLPKFEGSVRAMMEARF